MFILYQIIVSVLIIVSPIIILYRLIKKKEDLTRFKEKFCFPTKKRFKGKLIWFHGASIGEIMSVVPLIKNYENDRSIKQILLTSSTLSSSKIITKFKFKKTIHQFYPIDHFFFTNKFIKYWNPSIAIFIESEIWPCMFKNLNEKGIRLILLNARLTKKTFKKWMSIKSFARNIFNNISIAYPQNLETLSFLEQMNLKKINPIGNLKFAEKNDEKLNNLNSRLKTQLKRKKIWVASSTHKNEEIFCAKTHIILKKKVKNLLSIIIPRHVHRTKKIINEIKNLDLNVVTHSSKPKNLKGIDIYIVDTFGETKKFHKLGSSVFVGGSIINRGGQNPLEAARLGSKIFHGPNVDNFKDIYKLLESLKISKKVHSSKKLSSLIIFKKNKKIAMKIKNIGEKILKKTIKELDYLINNEIKKT